MPRAGRAAPGRGLAALGIYFNVIGAYIICATMIAVALYLSTAFSFAAMQVWLPTRFGFVIKREMAGVPLAGALLRRLGSEFVERFNRHRGGADARRVLRTAVGGNSLVFFPEGTFEPRPGLGKFHAGAFTIAARAGCPVVPAVVRGTRRALPPMKLWPHPARIEIEFLEPIVALADSHDAVVMELRDRARLAILEELREPDLVAERAAAA